jgi:hypothetical protein
MREKKFIHILSCVCVAILACGTAFAQGGKIQSGAFKGTRVPMMAPDSMDAPDSIFYTNLVANSCTGCNYSADNGYLVLGPSNCGIPGATQWLAYPFVANHTATTTRVLLSVTNWGVCTPTSNKFTVQIMGDNCTNAPDTTNVLGTAIATAPAAPCLLAQARMAAPLMAGNTYWVVVTTNGSPSQIGTTAVWWEANSAWADYNLNDGNGWIAFPAGSPGGFQVQ